MPRGDSNMSDSGFMKAQKSWENNNRSDLFKIKTFYNNEENKKLNKNKKPKTLFRKFIDWFLKNDRS